MANRNKTRIARLQNGDEYLVSRIDFSSKIVYCWDEIVQAKIEGENVLGIVHREGFRKFPKGRVQIIDVESITVDFCKRMLKQAAKNLEPEMKENRRRLFDVQRQLNETAEANLEYIRSILSGRI